MPQDVKVGLVIVTHNRSEILRRNLKSALSQTRPPDEVVVINNNSSDDTAAMLKRNFPTVVVQNRQDNTGGAGGFSYGIDHMLGRGVAYIWLMDDDAVPTENALERLLTAAADQRDNPPAFVSSYIVDSNGQRTQHSRNPPPNSHDLDGVQRGCYPAAFCSFVSVLIDSRFAEKTWLPMKDFFWLWDDTEYTGRLARLAGHGLVCYRSKVAHPLTLDPLRGKKLRLASRNAIWLIRFRSLGSPPVRERAKFGMGRIVRSDLLRTRAGIGDYGHFLAGLALGILTYPRRSHPTRPSKGFA